MRNKAGVSVLKALKETFKKMGYCMSIYSDDDGTFKSVVKEFFDAEGINHIITLAHANVVERFIRTLKNMVHDRVSELMKSLMYSSSRGRAGAGSFLFSLCSAFLTALFMKKPGRNL